MEEFNLLFEFGLSALYFMVILLWLYFYVINKKEAEYKYFAWGLVAKLFGGFCFGLVYMFYYKYGDTFMYYESAIILKNVFIDDPIYALKLVFNQADYVRAEDYLYNEFLVNYYRGDDTFTVIKIAGIFSILGLGGFFTTGMLFSLFAFYGQWKLYQTFIRRYPFLKFELALAHFFIPSVVFWGSGIMKDSLVIGLLGLLIFHLDNLFVLKRITVRNILSVSISAYLIYLLKGYVLLALFPGIFFWVFFSYSSRIKNSLVRFVIIPVVTILVLGLSVFSFQMVESVDSKYGSEELMNQAYIYQINHFSEEAIEGTTSGYTLGEFDKTFGGMIQKLIPSIVVTLFRPFPWEIKNLVMALSSLESLILTGFTLFVLVKMKFKRLTQYIGSDSFIVMGMVFTFIFAFLVGFSSYNFGALARYKIPCLSFYFSILFLLISEYKRSQMTSLSFLKTSSKKR